MTDTRTDAIELHRRQLLTALIVAGALGATPAARGDGDTGVDRGSSTMDTERSHLRLEWYRDSEGALPDPGIENRVVYVEEGGSDYPAGTVLRDTGTEWVRLEFVTGDDRWETDDDGTLVPVDERPVRVTDSAHVGDHSTIREDETDDGEPHLRIAFDPTSNP
ncbi:hypothetical protein [Natronococcus sp. A-GB7]|uniref:hypothetical protein n=1 Tax=Natronococcus sp. A-GB7 TaxID=3037649 RepID=UPI00241C52BC|nr:hypothetical protein [Natronococcus sp. A-GB7]MDG5819760.1 hypothetical protein [Natronococcus sp. A-GB7]